jgi:rRNA processing protein Gar1
MPVERVDPVGAEVAQAVVGDLPDVLGEMSKPYSCVHPNFVAITTSSRKYFATGLRIFSFSPHPYSSAVSKRSRPAPGHDGSS